MARIDNDVMKEIALARKAIFEAKKRLNDYTDNKDDILTIKTEDLENALCEESETVEEALADIENALCELSE